MIFATFSRRPSRILVDVFIYVSLCYIEGAVHFTGGRVPVIRTNAARTAASNGHECDDDGAVHVPAEINGLTETLSVRQAAEPYFAAAVFCRCHNIHWNLEGKDSTTLLAEEAIVRGGGSFVPWLQEEPPIIALRPSSARCVRHQVKAFCVRRSFPTFHCAALLRNVSVVVGASFGWSSSSSFGRELVNEGEVGNNFDENYHHGSDSGGSIAGEVEKEGLGCGNAYAAHAKTALKLTLENPIYIPLYAEALGDIVVDAYDDDGHVAATSSDTFPSPSLPRPPPPPQANHLALSISGLTTAVDPFWAAQRICVRDHPDAGRCDSAIVAGAIEGGIERLRGNNCQLPPTGEDGDGVTPRVAVVAATTAATGVPYIEKPELVLEIGLECFVPPFDVYSLLQSSSLSKLQFQSLKVFGSAAVAATMTGPSHLRNLVLWPGENPTVVAAAVCARQRCVAKSSVQLSGGGGRVRAVATLAAMIQAARDGTQPEMVRGHLQPAQASSSFSSSSTSLSLYPYIYSYSGLERKKHHDHQQRMEEERNDALVERVVVSLSTLPSRLPHVRNQLRYLFSQTFQPDLVYVSVPLPGALRERRKYDERTLAELECLGIASSGERIHGGGLEARGGKDCGGGYIGRRSGGECGCRENSGGDQVRVLRSDVDWGPATKLIPAVSAEITKACSSASTKTSIGTATTTGGGSIRSDIGDGVGGGGRTAVITVDDDVNYPPTVVEDLVVAGRRHLDSTLGLSGYRLQGPPFRHPNFEYLDATATPWDERDVDILGGMCGVLYRPAFFDARRLRDYGRFPGAAFFVDDDWISAALDQSGVTRVVLGINESVRRTAPLLLQEAALNYEVSQLASLNGEGHAFRNIMFQEVAVSAFVRAGMFSAAK